MAARWSLICYPASLLLLGALLAVSGASLASSAGASRPVEEDLGLAASLAGLALLGWWAAALALALAAEGLRRRGHAAAASAAAALTPAFMRRLAAAVLGVNLLAVPMGGHAASPAPVVQAAAPMVHAAAAPAAAQQARPGAVDGAESGTAESDSAESDSAKSNTADQPGTPARTPRVSPEWVPLPVPCSPGLLAREPARQAPGGRSGEVVVRPGDSLWSIAAARLGPLASDAEIAGNWPDWYARNASVIGPDPGLLQPGQVLYAPEPS